MKTIPVVLVATVLPLTALSYLFAAVLERVFLKEQTSWLRWAGIMVIVAGIVLVAMEPRQNTVQFPGKAAREYPGERGNG